MWITLLVSHTVIDILVLFTTERHPLPLFLFHQYKVCFLPEEIPAPMTYNQCSWQS